MVSHNVLDSQVFWLQTNWAHIIETVIHLANSYVAENALENVGQLSVLEAQAALRRCRGNVWNSVMDAVEKRQAAVSLLVQGALKQTGTFLFLKK